MSMSCWHPRKKELRRKGREWGGKKGTGRRVLRRLKRAQRHRRRGYDGFWLRKARQTTLGLKRGYEKQGELEGKAYQGDQTVSDREKQPRGKRTVRQRSPWCETPCFRLSNKSEGKKGEKRGKSEWHGQARIKGRRELSGLAPINRVKSLTEDYLEYLKPWRRYYEGEMSREFQRAISRRKSGLRSRASAVSHSYGGRQSNATTWVMRRGFPGQRAERETGGASSNPWRRRVKDRTGRTPPSH